MSAGRTQTSLSNSWCTPQKYVDCARGVLGGSIELDPCSNEHSLVAANVEYALPGQDGLSCSWDFKTIYVNPPYGADRARGTTIRDWLRNCALANGRYSSEVVALVPVATNTLHWKRYVFPHAHGVCFLYDTRLKFLSGGGCEKGAPMACALIYWGENIGRFLRFAGEHGAAINLHGVLVLPA